MLSRRGFVFVSAVSALHGQGRKPSKMFQNAVAYERFMGRWSRLVAPLLVDFTELPDRVRVLDVGSGTGSLAFALAEHKPRVRVLGIDPSKEYVTYANSVNPFPDRVGFRVGDAQQLRFPGASFDAALSLLVFNFIPDPARALSEMRRVTKPGGKLSAAVWDYGAGMRMLRAFWDAAVSVDASAERIDERRMPLCREGELPDLWRRSGLRNVRGRAMEIAMRFKSFPDYWDAFLLGQGPAGAYIRTIDRDKLQLLRGEVKRRLSVTIEDAPFVLPARVWSVCGTVPKAA